MTYSYDRRATMVLPDIRFKAATAADIKKKIEAYRVLFGVEPMVRVSGTLRATDGETAWLNRGFGEPVKQIGAVVTLNLGVEGLMRFKVEENADQATYILSGH